MNIFIKKLLGKAYSAEDLHWLSVMAKYKWPEHIEYSCLECGCTKYSKGRTPYSRKCSNMACKYEESVLSGTVFHGTRLPVSKCVDILESMMERAAGYIDGIFENERWAEKFVKGNLPFISGYFRMSTVDLARHHQIQQKTVWHFINKLVTRFNYPEWTAEDIENLGREYKNFRTWFKWIKLEKQSGYYELMRLLLRRNYDQLTIDFELEMLVKELIEKTHTYD